MLPRRILIDEAPRLLLQKLCPRYLSKTSQKPRPGGKHHRLWAIPGDHVLVRDILARQWQMHWHPGLNAGIDENRSIYSLCEGIMVITEEKFDPDWSQPAVKDGYTQRDVKVAPKFARYIHVIPKKRISEFKLIDTI